MISTHLDINKSRVWIYQSSRTFTDDEVSKIELMLQDFVRNWLSHGAPVHGNFEVKKNRFIVLMADESDDRLGGCSIDSSTHIIKTIEQEIQISLLDKSLLAFLVNDEIKTIPLIDIKKSVEKAEISEDTLYFNNSITSLKEYGESWLTSASQTWLSRYF